MTFIEFFFLVMKNLPSIERFLSAAWLGYESWKAAYEKQQAAEAVARAIKTSSAEEVDKLLGGR